jgi:hypothetical protein
MGISVMFAKKGNVDKNLTPCYNSFKQKTLESIV